MIITLKNALTTYGAFSYSISEGSNGKWLATLYSRGTRTKSLSGYATKEEAEKAAKEDIDKG